MYRRRYSTAHLIRGWVHVHARVCAGEYVCMVVCWCGCMDTLTMRLDLAPFIYPRDTVGIHSHHHILV